MSLADDPIAYVLSRGVVAPPGAAFLYNGGLPSVLAASVEHATGRTIERYAIEELFCALGVRRFEWVRHPSGLHLAASGLRLTPRDIARFGQLMLDEGRVGDRQLVPRDYARASLAAQLETGGGLTSHYGYQWWITHRHTTDAVRELPLALGNGGQRIALDRDSRTVIVITAGAYDSPRQGEGPAQAIEAVLAALR